MGTKNRLSDSRLSSDASGEVTEMAIPYSSVYQNQPSDQYLSEIPTLTDIQICDLGLGIFTIAGGARSALADGQPGNAQSRCAWLFLYEAVGSQIALLVS